MFKENLFSNIKYCCALLTLSVILLSITSIQPAVEANETKSASTYTSASKVSKNGLKNTPLLFEQNQGQVRREAKFISRGDGYSLYLTDKEAVFSLKTTDADAKS